MKNLFFLALFSTTILLQLACKSTQKLYEDGKYERVFNSLASKASKAKLSSDEQSIFLRAIDDWTKDQSNNLNQLLETREPKDWKNGLAELKTIAELQDKFDSYPQIRTKDYAALDVPAFKEEFYLRLYDYHQYFFNDFFEKYDESGDKREVIQAYGELQEMHLYGGEQYYLDSLEAVCLALGHRNFVIDIDNRTVGNFYEFNTSFVNRIALYDDKWSTYHKSLADSLIDYVIKIDLVDINEDRRDINRTQTYSREIVDGYETVTDTSGRTTQVPIYRTVTAQVDEVGHTFIVQTRAEVSVYNNVTRRRDYGETYIKEAYEEVLRNYLRSGDTQAVPSNVRLESGAYTNFPNYDYGTLISRALEGMADDVEADIRRF